MATMTPLLRLALPLRRVLPSRRILPLRRMLPLRQILPLLLVSGTVLASQAQLKDGNRQFKNGHYDQALKLYEDAQALMGNFPKAEASFMESAKSVNPLLKGASHYNRGNA